MVLRIRLHFHVQPGSIVMCFFFFLRFYKHLDFSTPRYKYVNSNDTPEGCTLSLG